MKILDNPTATVTITNFFCAKSWQANTVYRNLPELSSETTSTCPPVPFIVNQRSANGVQSLFILLEHIVHPLQRPRHNATARRDP